MLSLFNSNSVLNQGYFKLPLYKPPLPSTLSPGTLRLQPLVPDAFTLFVSINRECPSAPSSQPPHYILPRIHRRTSARLSRRVSLASSMASRPASNICQGLMVTIQGLVNHLGNQPWQVKLGITDKSRLMKDENNQQAKRSTYVYRVFPSPDSETPIRD